MALFRTSLSLDRTTLAWIRTTLTMTSFGLGTVTFFRSIRCRPIHRRMCACMRARFGLVWRWC
ncbi:DUF202 domain-containing protein [Tunturiibacter gelidiferens]|uniref:DUF202 domain-containing protein n=1 Tax=Tunturiibacter gelidiferens TaxID=3069689 RepID=UPI0015CEA312